MIDVPIGLLLKRQVDIKADGLPLGAGSAFVSRFHDPRTAAGNDGVTFFDQQRGRFSASLCQRSVFFVLDEPKMLTAGPISASS